MQRFFKPSEFHLLQDAKYHNQKVLVTLNDKPETWHYSMDIFAEGQGYQPGCVYIASIHPGPEDENSVIPVDLWMQDKGFIFNVADASLIELIE